MMIEELAKVVKSFEMQIHTVKGQQAEVLVVASNRVTDVEKVMVASVESERRKREEQIG